MTQETNISRIGRIIEAVRKAIDGDFSFHIETSGKNDEIDILAGAINQLAENTKDHIVSRKKSLSAFLGIEEKYRRLEANIPGMVYLFVMHPDGTSSFPYVNEASQKLFGISPEDLMRDATLITRLIHPDDREIFDTSVKHSAETLQPWREVLRHIVYGEVRWYDCMSRPELQPNGDILWDGIILEVTDRMKAEESLSKSQKELSGVISVSPVGIAIYNGNEQCISTNDSFARIIGATKQQVLEQNYGNIESWKKTGLLDTARTAVRTQSAKRLEVVTISSFGKEIFLDCHLIPFGEEGLLFMAQGNTERKRAEEELKTTLQMADDIVRYIPFGMFIYQYVEPDKLYLKAGNPESEKITGVKVADLIGMEYGESWPGAGASGLTKAYLEVMRTGNKYEADQLYYKDEKLEGSFHICAFRLPNDLLAVSFEDISERKQWAEALSESEATLRSIYESSPMLMGIVELTVDDKIVHIYDNPATARFFNIEYKGTKNKEADELGAPSEAISEWMVHYRQSQQQGKPVRFEYVHPGPDGPLWLSATVSIIGPGHNGRTRFSYVAEDITKRKLAEIQMQGYADRQKVLLREVNHRVKNNLAVIIGMLHKEEDLAKNKKQTLFLPLLYDLEGRIKGLLTVHSMFSSTNWQPLLLSQLCERIITGIIKSYGSDISLNISASKMLVDSDQAHHLSMVINELATNSLKYALSEPVRTRIDVDIEEKADRILLTFRDNGPGYPDNIISGEYIGTSIGFDLICGIVKKSLRGTISFRNENGAVSELVFDKTEKAEMVDS